LHYQEVKWRKLGSYEHRLHLKPGRLAKHELEVFNGYFVHFPAPENMIPIG
uniref:Inter-alpha-trypsin inhibitor heavy chain H2 (Fragments) n=1 Tax=Bos taurus TaxID=9913 RepID=ITIH2_BOVIN|nr:RecName: Full=Inter-alpha-trypsin inhibitor heavy chain H2; Short=ITI heavy chain H2; Short=ITI-HC2; Short=Inter-alpha-inhibitor heavy chain 2 [Bos taurus]